MAFKRMINVDYDKLELATLKKKVNLKDFCQFVGYNRGYTNDIRKNGRVSFLFANTLKQIHGIDVSEYEHKEEKPIEQYEQMEAPRDPKQDFKMIQGELYQLIFNAVYEGARQGIKRGMREYREQRNKG